MTSIITSRIYGKILAFSRKMRFKSSFRICVRNVALSISSHEPSLVFSKIVGSLYSKRSVFPDYLETYNTKNLTLALLYN